MLLPRDPLQSHSRATGAQLIGELFYFCKQTLTHAPVSCASFIPQPMYSSPSLPPPPPALLPPSIFFVCLFALFFLSSFPACLCAFLLHVSLSALHRPHCQDTLQEKRRERKKISGIVLIQTDIKRHRARKIFLCRLIISLCFSAPFTVCLLVTSISSLEGSSGLCSPGLSENGLDAAFEATQIWQKRFQPPSASFFSHFTLSLTLSLSLFVKYPSLWYISHMLACKSTWAATQGAALIFHKLKPRAKQAIIYHKQCRDARIQSR